jgi:diguanylate cyclase (GGDEF)-like protein/PAS domain S-box-containing protein
VFYLAAPTSFRVTLAGGVFCSLCMLAGYLSAEPFGSTSLGMVLVLLIHNVVLILVVSRTNRMRRLEWATVQAERTAREELAESKGALRKLFMAVPVPLIVVEVDSGRLVEANDAAFAYFGATLNEVGLSNIEHIYVDPADRAVVIGMLRRDGHVDAFETRIRLADGSVHHVLLACSMLTVDGRACTITGVVDISRHKEVEAHLDRLAATDPLTGLPNRTRFLEIARAEIERATRYQRAVTVMMFDLDHFKRLNDTHGHAAGDAALRAFAALCQATLRVNDVAARLGGEEFAAILPETTAANALTLAERLRSETERLAPEGQRLTVSIGIAEVRSGETSIDAALARADAALYAAKRAGRNRVRSEEPPQAA